MRQTDVSIGLKAAFESFLAARPAYAATVRLDALRDKDYARLDRNSQVYLDYTAGSLHGESQIDAHAALLRAGVLGNPHSNNPASREATRLAESARACVRRFFHAPPEEYAVIFTANASAAVKLVGEAYPFAPGSRYLLTFDNHNAANGLREFARGKGAAVTYVPVGAEALRLDGGRLLHELDRPGPGAANLFAYPAQSNFSGVRHPLRWIEEARSRGWDVLLDAAAFVPTNRLDLERHRPDFVPVSFYKMFGYPTGVGCLIARREALKKLRRPWFSGGTIEVATVQGNSHFLAEGERAFEDGTVNYLSLPAVEIGLAHLDSAGLDAIHERIACLTGWLLEHPFSLRHANGTPLAEVYGPRDTSARGGTIAFNFLDPAGNRFDFLLVEERAAEAGISLRTGCFCNPGAGEIAFGLTEDDVSDCIREERASYARCLAAARGKTAGAVRISLGIASNFPDVYRFLLFARGFIDLHAR